MQFKELVWKDIISDIEIDSQLAFMDRIERQAKAEAEKQRKYARNPFYKIACMCGLI